MTNENLTLQIKKILGKNLRVHALQINDFSARHKNHPEAQKSGGGHYSLFIVTDDFAGKSLIERHRLINGLLKNLMGTKIHALEIKAMTLKEAEEKKK